MKTKFKKKLKDIYAIQWFDFENRKLVAETASDLYELKIPALRTCFSWADWERNGAEEWFDFLVNALALKGLILFPSLFYTPVNKAIPDKDGRRKSSCPPKNVSDYADFVEIMIIKYGKHFEWVQIWNEPNWTPYWDDSIDPDYRIFSSMANLAADRIHEYGKKAALGGLSPFEPEWISLMHKYGTLEKMDSISMHYSPSWTDRRRWFGFETEIYNVRALLKGLNSNAEVWIAETGVSTFANDTEEKKLKEIEQTNHFERIRKLDADKIFWYCARDQAPEAPTDDQLNFQIAANPVAYHFGWRDYHGKAKPLFDHWKKNNKKAAF